MPPTDLIHTRVPGSRPSAQRAGRPARAPLGSPPVAAAPPHPAIAAARQYAESLLADVRRQNAAHLAAAQRQADVLLVEANTLASRTLARAAADNVTALEAAEARARRVLALAERWVRTGADADREALLALADSEDDPAPAAGDAAPRPGEPPLLLPNEPLLAAAEAFADPPPPETFPLPTPGASRAVFAETDGVPGSVEVVAGPFRRFTQLAEFVRALNSLGGVLETRTRRFYRGTVSLRVHYDGAVPLHARLDELRGMKATLVSATPYRLELLVDVAAEPDAEAA